VTEAGFEEGRYDLVILGGGSGGYACALRAAELGMRVALVEKDKVGGTCLHRGCIPTKALLHAAEVADLAHDGPAVGVLSSVGGIDMAAVNAYKDKVVTRLWKGLTGLVASRKIDVVEGVGRLVSPTSVQVDGRLLTGGHVVLATGSETRTLPGLEIDGRRVITSEQALELDHVPASVVVLGGGVIGVEFASVWRSFGAEVTIVEMLPHLVPTEEESSSKLLERAFRRRGIAFKTGVRFDSVKDNGDGVTVVLGDSSTIEAELMLVAVGRGPVSAGLGYEEVGVALDRGFVLVDEHCQTNIPTISAVGDLRPGPQLAHVGFAEGIMVAERLARLNPPPIDYDGVPRITYSSPEVASVGITSGAAAARGIDFTEFTYDLAGNGKSQILQTAGSVKVLVEATPGTPPHDGATGRTLGVHVVGARAGDLISEAQLIVNWEATPADVAQLIHPHPTQSEAIGEAFLALAGKPLHNHG
jgi:dihydrolipoamide dehydrogenase